MTPSDLAVVLQYEHQWQETKYWCGPAAARVALSCRGIHLTQAELAGQLGTDGDGTDHIGQITRVLGSLVGWYETKEMPSDPPSPEQRDLLWRDVTHNVDNGYGLVANIVAPPGNHPPGYPSDQTIYHYFTVVGYQPDSRDVFVVDSAQFSQGQYWIGFDLLASLIPPKGYSA
ncbi:C39 family peptidase [Demetria terragena]|uniref:C39 family peptidase n=1 Tax=Demetria terragena TaxID=63959 RepID=UPI00037E14F4|nr:C39 family peptidase [Demetria terragena]